MPTPVVVDLVSPNIRSIGARPQSKGNDKGQEQPQRAGNDKGRVQEQLPPPPLTELPIPVQLAIVQHQLAMMEHRYKKSVSSIMKGEARIASLERELVGLQWRFRVFDREFAKAVAEKHEIKFDEKKKPRGTRPAQKVPCP